MTRSLNERLADLERSASHCPDCDAGAVVLLPFRLNGDGELPDPPRPCGTCGATAKVVTLAPLRLDGDREVMS